MTREEYQEMLNLKKQLKIYENALDAGYAVDRIHYECAQEEFAKFVERFKEDAWEMDLETEECFRLRYVCGYTYHNIMAILWPTKSETTARKRISRWFKKQEMEGRL